MKVTFCNDINTAAYLTAEGMPCLPGIPCVMKQGKKATFLVLGMDGTQILFIPVELPTGWGNVPDGNYLIANGAVSYVDGMLFLTRGNSILVEV
jgi:hypothetical protein